MTLPLTRPSTRPKIVYPSKLVRKRLDADGKQSEVHYNNTFHDPDDFPALAAEGVKTYVECVMLPSISLLPSTLEATHYHLSGQPIEEKLRLVDELHQETYKTFAVGLISMYERHLREYLIWFGRKLDRPDLEAAGREARGAVVGVLSQITGFRIERPVGVLNEAIVMTCVWRHGPGAALDAVYNNTKSRYHKPYLGEEKIDLARMHNLTLRVEHLSLLARSILRVWKQLHKSRAVRYVPDQRQPPSSNSSSKKKSKRNRHDRSTELGSAGF